MSGGREVDIGGPLPDYKYVHNKSESELLTRQAEYSQSCQHQGSCLATEHSMIKSSTSFHVFNADPSPQCPPCVHLTSCDKCSSFSPLFHLNANQRTKTGEAWE